METNSTPKFWIITILILLFVGVMMIPITGLVISPKPIPNQIDTPIYELANYSLNDIWGTPESYDVDTFIMDNDTPITELNNYTLREVFEESTIYGVGKNLLDKMSVFATRRTSQLTPLGTVTITQLTNGIQLTNDTTFDGVGFYVNVLPSTAYILSLATNTTDRYGVYFYDNNNNEIGTVLTGGQLLSNLAISTPANTSYIRIVLANSTPTTTSFTNLQLEQGSTSTTYEPYKSSLNNDNPPFEHWFNLDTLGISSLTVEQMDYWFNVYQAIENNDPISNDEPSIIYEGYYITDLIDNKEWSPLYQTTFDLLSEVQIMAQMDLWIANPYQFINYNSFAGWTPSQSQVIYYHELYLYYSSF